MTHQVIFNTEANIFVEDPELYKDAIDFHNYLEEYSKEAGFKVGVRNIDELSDDDFGKARNNTFGASDAAVLLGVAYSSKTVSMKTTPQLVYEKANAIFDTEIGKLPAVRKGKEQEPWIIDKISKRWSIHLIKPRHMYVNGPLAVNYDAVSFEKSINEDDIITSLQPIPFEIKSCSFFGRKNYNWNLGTSEFSDEGLPLKRKYVPTDYDLHITQYVEKISEFYGIPKYYYTQLQQQMIAAKAPYGYLGVMDDINWTIYVYRIEADEKVQNAIKQTSKEAGLMLKQEKK